MAEPTAAEIVAGRYSGSASPAAIALELQLAEGRTSASAFGGRRPEAVALLALHNLAGLAQAASSGDGSARVVTGEHEGQLSRTYGGSAGGGSGDEDDLMGTVWGRRLLALRAECIVPGLVAGEC